MSFGEVLTLIIICILAAVVIYGMYYIIMCLIQEERKLGSPFSNNKIIIVSDKVERFQLKEDSTQNGDIVKQRDNGIVYVVKDNTKLNTENGYVICAPDSEQGYVSSHRPKYPKIKRRRVE